MRSSGPEAPAAPVFPQWTWFENYMSGLKVLESSSCGAVDPVQIGQREQLIKLP